MPFCIECGKEIASDLKFCIHCGAQQETAGIVSPPQAEQVPPPPVPPQMQGPSATSPDMIPPPPPPMPLAPPVKKPAFPKNTVIIVAAVSVLVIIAVVSFIGLPILKGTTQSGPETVYTTVPTPLATTSPVIRVPTSVPTTTVPPTPVITQEERYEETYEQIYTSNQTYKFGGKVVFSHNLTRPPLYIKFNVIPGMVNSTKIVDIGLASEHTVYAVYPSPNAWFEVKVLNANSGEVVDKHGFNKDYSVMTKQEFMVRTKGDYRIELSGNDVTVLVRILIGD